jgi:hypothetical protein
VKSYLATAINGDDAGSISRHLAVESSASGGKDWWVLEQYQSVRSAGISNLLMESAL